MTRLTINRAEWLRGEGSEDSRLLRSSDGRRCCVGIYLRACGVPDASLAERRVADEVDLPDEAFWLEDDDDASLLYRMNDEEFDDDEEVGREERIAALFAQQDITVTFVGP